MKKLEDKAENKTLTGFKPQLLKIALLFHRNSIWVAINKIYIQQRSVGMLFLLSNIVHSVPMERWLFCLIFICYQHNVPMEHLLNTYDFKPCQRFIL